MGAMEMTGQWKNEDMSMTGNTPKLQTIKKARP